ncbi:MAG: DUF1223 domain-containing protein [Pseudomonadota bacterium]
MARRGGSRACDYCVTALSGIRRLMKAISLLFAAIVLAGGPTLVRPAVGQPVLVELFASQNCRACPKAHETLRAVEADGANVLILTWSVDYWDYLGDADPMAMEESVERQRAYVEKFRLRGPYTPQTVYNGVVQCPGNRPRAVTRNLGKASDVVLPRASITAVGGALVVEGEAGAAGAVTLVEYLPDSAHGTRMRNPVVRHALLGSFDGARLELAVPSCAHRCAVLLEMADRAVPAVLDLAGATAP